MKDVVLIALKPYICSVFIYIKCARRISSMNMLKKLGQILGPEKFSLVFES